MCPNGRVLAAAALAVTMSRAGRPARLAAQPATALPAPAPAGTAGVEMPGPPPPEGTGSR